jgi:hypothetical protein
MRHTAPVLMAFMEASSAMVFAYLDPAAGGMIIQTLIAAAVAVPFILRSQIARVVARVKGQRTEKEPSSSDQA